MGNGFIKKYNNNAFRFISTQSYVTEYLYTIEVENLNIDIIENKLKNLHNKNIDESMSSIIRVINYYKDSDNFVVLSQIDGYLFDDFDNIKLLEIRNTNAKENKEKYNLDKKLYYYKVCDLSKLVILF
jgi:hypothetical protein